METSVKVNVLNFFRNVFRIPGIESLLSSLTAGKSPRHLICKLVPNPYQYTSPAFRIFRRHGIVMKVDVSDYVGHYLYFGFEDAGMKELFSLCKKDYNVLDVGSNIGWTALNLASITQQGRVLAFEPDPYNFERCSENIARNSFKNITALPVGLGNKSGRVHMEIRTPSNRGGNRIATAPSLTTHGVEVVRLDDFGPARELASIDLIKMDVEGFELHVLRGAEQVLRNHKPALFIELDDNNLRDQGDSALELISFLLQTGYHEIMHAGNHNPVSITTDFRNCHFDIIAK